MPTRFSFLASRLSQTVLVLWVVATLLFLIFPADAGQPPGRLHRSELHRGGAAGTPAPVWPGPAAARAVRRLPVKSGAWRVRPLLLQPRAGESGDVAGVAEHPRPQDRKSVV